MQSSIYQILKNFLKIPETFTNCSYHKEGKVNQDLYFEIDTSKTSDIWLLKIQKTNK